MSRVGGAVRDDAGEEDFALQEGKREGREENVRGTD